jgi:hypothetical protein
MRFLVLFALALVLVPALAVPPGYRYVGSRVVSAGRVVYWYWNADHVEIAPEEEASSRTCLRARPT